MVELHAFTLVSVNTMLLHVCEPNPFCCTWYIMHGILRNIITLCLKYSRENMLMTDNSMYRPMGIPGDVHFNPSVVISIAIDSVLNRISL